MLTLIDTDSLACACRILGWNLPEKEKGNVRLLLKYILRQLNSEDVEVSNYGSYSRYKKLHDHLRVRFPKKAFSFKQKSELHESRLFGRDHLSQNFIWGH